MSPGLQTQAVHAVGRSEVQGAGVRHVCTGGAMHHPVLCPPHRSVGAAFKGSQLQHKGGQCEVLEWPQLVRMQVGHT